MSTIRLGNAVETTAALLVTLCLGTTSFYRPRNNIKITTEIQFPVGNVSWWTRVSHTSTHWQRLYVESCGRDGSSVAILNLCYLDEVSSHKLKRISINCNKNRRNRKKKKRKENRKIRKREKKRKSNHIFEKV